MSAQEMHKSMGLGLCLLVSLVTIAVMVKIGIDLNNIEFSVSPASASVLPTGESAPEFSLEDLDGNEVRLTDQRGQVVLVNFWATWCGPCLQELPHIQQIHEKYQDQGLVVLAISTDHQKSAVRPFVEKNGYTFPVLFVDEEVENVYQIRGIPVVYLIDRTGVIRFDKVGFCPGGEKEIERQVEQLLEEEMDIPLP